MRRLPPFALILLIAGCAQPEGENPVGSVAPDFKVETLSVPSSSASLASKKGKVVILDFWATWCGPCREISPALESIYAQHKAEGLEAMAITTEAREIVKLNEKQRPHAIPVYLDTSTKAHIAYGAQGLPTLVVIDRKGNIVYKTVGVGPTTPDDISQAVTAALGKI